MESLFDKVADLQDWIKHKCFPVNSVKFLNHLFYKTFPVAASPYHKLKSIKHSARKMWDTMRKKCYKLYLSVYIYQDSGRWCLYLQTMHDTHHTIKRFFWIFMHLSYHYNFTMFIHWPLIIFFFLIDVQWTHCITKDVNYIVFFKLLP